ncbi:MAG TPA: FtsW/RodA/SpoVE family cell cycle protein [Clostridia bacterium]|nr:FtsW/RodA/SpoVE family cell cycle protein [Clostridia bacterium]
MQCFTKIDEFLETVCEQVRWQKAHGMIHEEIKNHIIDQKNAFMDEGLDENTATDKAIKEMGDPVLIGTELDQAHRPKTEWGIIFLTGIMLLFGFGIRLFVSYDSHTPLLLGKNLISMLIGIGCMIAAYFADFTIIGKYPKSIFAGFIVAIVAAMYLFPAISGRHTYAQFILLLFPIAISGIIYNMRTRGYAGIILSGAFLIITVLIGDMIPSLSMMVPIISAFLILITTAIIKGWFNVDRLHGILLIYVPMVGIMGTAFIKWIFGNSYRRDRLLNAINPSGDPMGSGYIATRIRELLSGAKFVGRGFPGLSSYMLPEINTNYILTYLIHRLGWISLITIMVIISIFVIHAFILCSKQKSVLGRLVSTAVLITFTMEAISYIISNLGFPIITSTLPFISYSGMSIIINMALIGIMLSVFKSGDVIRDELLLQKND